MNLLQILQRLFPPPSPRKAKMGTRIRPLTGPLETGRWGCGATDLGIYRDLGNGETLAIFGDTFDGGRVGQGAWRSPVGLIGNTAPDGHINFTRAAGKDPNWAQQLWDYPHNNPQFSTVLPSDVVRLPDGALVLHVMVNKGLGNVQWTELWKSTDNGVTWVNSNIRLEPWWDNGKRQLWTMEYEPKDGNVYVMSTGFQRNKGIILWRVKWDKMFEMGQWQPWTWKDGRWQWGIIGDAPFDIIGGRWGELNLRIVDGTWCLTAFDAGALEVVTFVLNNGPISDIANSPKTVHVGITNWARDGIGSEMAQPYGGYVMPGSKLDTPDGFKLAISQWNTDNSTAGAAGWPYRVLAYNSTVNR